MVPFDSLSMVSYSHFIATVAIYFADSTQCTNATTPHDGIGRAYA